MTSDIPVLTSEVDQRVVRVLLARDLDRNYLANHDVVITSSVDRICSAFQRSERTVDQRRAGHLPRAMRDVVELPLQRTPSGRQPTRSRLSSPREDRYGPMLTGRNRIVEPGITFDAYQDKQAESTTRR